jgi:deazaflavin-dependent oxidoreductase (nitroreductase family)
MPPTTPGRGPGNGEAASHSQSGTPRTARQYRPGRGRHVENMVMSALARAGLVPRSYLLTTRGRKTGLPHTNPVVPVEHGGRRWLVAPYGPVAWVHNARAAGWVRLTRRRDTRHYTIREVSPRSIPPCPPEGRSPITASCARSRTASVSSRPRSATWSRGESSNRADQPDLELALGSSSSRGWPSAFVVVSSVTALAGMRARVTTTASSRCSRTDPGPSAVKPAGGKPLGGNHDQS